ncbi:hypothetical protein [Parafrankia sp. BMG5.11]|uniref:hypothetical protein n=1 Tax=Parafrankia sp. BMG5.11 TaxID=222540 RepID=UPI00103B54DA|nr:hypothetical protein [Parafrankia sp. BMG5.11]TCJ37371.1 hypothetical protein E0504_20250 [Parafrankia sp. BMG5.11]
MIDAAILIRRHLPLLISDTENVCRGAAPAERAQFLAQLVTQLQAFAVRADALTERGRQQAREELALRHTHLRARLSEMSDAPGAGELQSLSEVKHQDVAGVRTDGANPTWWAWISRPFTLWR